MIKMSGRRWAYVGLFLGLSASITANVASTVLAQSEISLFLRVPFAVVWPVLTYIAIEVLTRTDWRRSASHILIRAVISVPVAAVAAFVSYLHQHELMILAAEPGLAQLVGPLAVDGMLFGMTATLIVTRVSAKASTMMLLEHERPIGPMPAPRPAVTQELISADVPEFSLEQLLPQPREWSTAELDTASVAPVSPAPRAPRAPRAAEWDVRKAAEMAVDGAKGSEISAATGASPATAGRFVKVAKILKADPRAEISAAEKVRPEGVRIMRELISR
jgi:hypothetical protein